MERVTHIRERLSKPLEINFLNEILESVIQYPEDFNLLYQLIGDDEHTISWRAAWACDKLSRLYPDWFLGKEEELMSALFTCRHDGKKRLILSILFNIPAPSEFPVKLLDYSLQHMFDHNESIAAQSLYIKMAYKLCLVEPELMQELKLYLENAEIEYYSTAVKTCVRNVLRKLN